MPIFTTPTKKEFRHEYKTQMMMCVYVTTNKIHQKHTKKTNFTPHNALSSPNSALVTVHEAPISQIRDCTLHVRL